jgi:outer membrane protein
VYGTLNQLTSTNSFPQIENTAIQFLPNNFYDAKITLTQPIYYPDLYINRDVKSQQVLAKELEIKSYKRWISQEVMTAYFQWMTASEASQIYKNALVTIEEASRATTSMIKNGIATPIALSRIDNQKASIQALIIDSESNAINAQSYVRYITGLNNADSVPMITMGELPDTATINGSTREELMLIDRGMTLTNLGMKKEQQFYKPRIGAGVDMGSQAFNFGWQPYAILGLNFDVSLYDHKRHKHAISTYRADINSLEAKKADASKKFDLMQSIAHQDLVSSVRQAMSIKPRIVIASKVYGDAIRRYKEGITNYLEVIDSQSQITQMELQYNIAKFKAWNKWANYVYATASFPVQ